MGFFGKRSSEGGGAPEQQKGPEQAAEASKVDTGTELSTLAEESKARGMEAMKEAEDLGRQANSVREALNQADAEWRGDAFAAAEPSPEVAAMRDELAALDAKLDEVNDALHTEGARVQKLIGYKEAFEAHGVDLRQREEALEQEVKSDEARLQKNDVNPGIDVEVPFQILTGKQAELDAIKKGTWKKTDDEFGWIPYVQDKVKAPIPESLPRFRERGGTILEPRKVTLDRERVRKVVMDSRTREAERQRIIKRGGDPDKF